MTQVLEFRLPDLGEGLTEAQIVRWLVQVGDVVAIDEPVVEVETAKAMVEVPCPYGGVVTARYGDEGTELPVGAPLLTVAVGAPAEDDQGSGNVLVGYGTGAPPARRRRARPRSGAVPDMPRRAAAPPVAASTPPPPEAAPKRPEGPVPVISPLVRRLAREHGLDLRELAGSGPDGLILRADVEHALRAAAAAAPPSAPATAVPAAQTETVSTPTRAESLTSMRAESLTSMRAEGLTPTRAESAAASAAAGTRIPLRGVRGAVADKLSRSRREIPDATCWVDADATELMHARATMNAADGPKISLLALLARICTAALARFPELNSTVDLAAREIVRLDRVHLGFAAQTERGLVVPVVRDAHTRDAQSLTAEFARLTEAARTGTLTPAELTGGTFTLNNYGVFGVDGSTPIINHPEAAMLGVGRIVPKPWVHQGELAVRQVVQLSLTFDHRVCDGGTAGGFLRYVADCVEQPVVLLRSL
ncbi:dihydrolipoamide acetyltransferase family protein [Streptomyces acidicola]|uniref:Dihydrolipoamide acetyltransferase component of pyruvate dehydrogenase complex n=1 Tax=Streptomyces acidicola TaxID=2596892 RepID=A0A5N8WT74_9ACTN|nr:dihydrolipoamide acetyltransferase family protein [Streptomyces acidicola]MPY50479.1 2-oxo acid dehydrogenase subunit E2 [Streptomyces acidicola]